MLLLSCYYHVAIVMFLPFCSYHGIAMLLSYYLPCACHALLCHAIAMLADWLADLLADWLAGFGRLQIDWFGGGCVNDR
jgi:hypothetical protein